MATLSKKQEKTAKVLKPTLNHKDNIHDLSGRGLKSLDITLVLAAYGSLTSVNLSNNLLMFLPDSFCRVLCHITYLDLSNNILQKLPDNVGLLQNLHTLIIYQNKLRTLPASFGVLEQLKWLDVAANPWGQCMRQIFGDDITQCAVVAKNVKEFFFLVQHAAENCTEPEPPKTVEQDEIVRKTKTKSKMGDANHVQTQDELNEMALNILRETQEIFKHTCNVGDNNQNIQENWFTKRPDAHRDKRERQKSSLTKTTFLLCFIMIFLSVSTATAWLHGPPKSLVKNGSMRTYEWIPGLMVDSFAWMFWCTVHQLRCIFPHPRFDDLCHLLIVPRSPSVLRIMFGL